MSKKKTKVCVGIPAYNEEANIEKLIKRLLLQKQEQIALEEIIVVSDASTDSTGQIVRNIKENKLKLVELKKRRGLSDVQNVITRMANSDILVIINADVLPADDAFLEEICRPIRELNVDLVSSDTIPAISKNLFEKTLSDAHFYLRRVYKSMNQGNNIHTCTGKAKAFSYKLYKNIFWTKNFLEDSYSYFECLRLGGHYKFAPKAKVYFKMRSCFEDYLSQVCRFRKNIDDLASYYGNELVFSKYKIPFKKKVAPFISYFIEKPISALHYLFIRKRANFGSKKDINIDYSMFDSPKSTKFIAL